MLVIVFNLHQYSIHYINLHNLTVFFKFCIFRLALFLPIDTLEHRSMTVSAMHACPSVNSPYISFLCVSVGLCALFCFNHSILNRGTKEEMIPKF